jgi:polar amino acid transport system substrate-binding protein
VRKITALIASMVLVVGIAACGSDDDSGNGGSGGGGGDAAAKCSKSTSGEFTPVKEDTLTVATSLPAPGFWNGDDPGSITGGFEYGMAEAMAKLAGLANVEVKNVSFDALVAGQTSDFDVALSQVTITPERAKVVCFTTDYFSSDQGILVKAGTEVTAENQKSIKWGVQGSTTGQTFVNDEIQPDSEPSVYQDTPAMFTALSADQIDAVLLDTAIVLGQANESDGELEVVGQYKVGESYGGILENGSKNLGFIDEYIDSMKTDGTLDTLRDEFLVPVYKVDPAEIPYLEP